MVEQTVVVELSAQQPIKSLYILHTVRIEGLTIRQRGKSTYIRQSLLGTERRMTHDT